VWIKQLSLFYPLDNGRRPTHSGTICKMSTLDNWNALLTEMVRNAPDPNEPLPLSNRPETIYGTTITFLV